MPNQSMGWWSSAGCDWSYPGLSLVGLKAQPIHGLVEFYWLWLTISTVRLCSAKSLISPWVVEFCWLWLGFLIFAFYFISRNTKPYESLACFAKILLVSRNKNMRNFVSFCFALQKLKRKFASFRKNLVSFRENFVLFRIERDIVLRILPHSSGPRPSEVAGDRPIEIVSLCLI